MPEHGSDDFCFRTSWVRCGDRSAIRVRGAQTLSPAVLLVAAWGWFLYQGVIDPLGGINSLWPLFGLANQLLSVIALCLGTTLLIKMHKAKYIFVTLVPLGFMCAVTFSAGYLKVFSSDPRLGFLSGARSLLDQASTVADPAKAAELVRQAGVWRFDALVAVFFLVLVAAIVLGSARQWWQLIRGSEANRFARKRVCADYACAACTVLDLIQILPAMA